MTNERPHELANCNNYCATDGKEIGYLNIQFDKFCTSRATMKLVVLLLVTLVFGVSEVSCDSCPSGSYTFYIKPFNASRSDCPVAGCPCITLDHLAVNELPSQRNSDSITLVLLEGIHTSTVPLSFIEIQHVIIAGQNTADLWAVTDAEAPDPLTIIQLQSSNISVIDVSILEIKNLAIDGGGRAVLLMQKHSGSWSVSFHQINMARMIVQIQPLSVDAIAVVTITSCLFKISRIEIKLHADYYNAVFEANRHTQQNTMIQQIESVLHIKNAKFLTRNEIQSTSVVIFSPDSFESQRLTFVMENVTIMALQGNIPLPSFPLPYDATTKILRPSDVYVFSDYVKMTVTNSHFLGNKGTAIYAENSLIRITNCTLSGYSQGALVFDGSVELKLVIDSTDIFNNTVVARELAAPAAALMISSYGQTDLVNCYFFGNSDLSGNSQIIELNRAGQANIHNSTFANNNGTVISGKHSTLSFSGVVTFTGNSGHRGGALSLSSVLKTIITLAEYTAVNFVHNSASCFGGAIYIDSYPSLILAKNDENNNIWCFYGPLTDSSSFKHITLNFRNNSAAKGGDHVYGISVKNHCKINSVNFVEDPWKHVFAIEPNKTLSAVASDALRVCICDERGQPQCTGPSKIFATGRAVYPGESFSVSAVTVGAEFGTTVGEVYAKLLPRSSSRTAYNASLGDSRQPVLRITENDRCTVLQYSVLSRRSYEIMYLTVADWTRYTYGDVSKIHRAIEEYKKTEVIPRSLLITPIFINITLRFPCPMGFTLFGEPPRCDCYSELRKSKINCTIQDGTGYVSRSGGNWIGVRGEEVIFNGDCPLSHCKPEKELLDLENGSDAQCSFDHSGTLCGGCKEGYSVAIGSSNCIYCPSSANSVVFLFFVSAGPLLYVLIATFDLTITKGAINGLLFYANVVWIYQTALFSVTTCEVTDIFKVFVAWLNLDFGIEMCFVKGLDAFWKSLLQYVFPMYIWIIAYMVVLVYRHTSIHQRFPRLSKLLGNPSHVLVTFLLMSYTKFTRTIIDALRFSTLTSYPSNSKDIVWALDGNIRYFRGKHVLLFILALDATIVSLFFSVHILIMGFKNNALACKRGGWIQILNPNREAIDQIHGELDAEDDFKQGWIATCLAQLHRCKSIVDLPLPVHDALFAAHNSRYKYWLGLMLLIRVALLIFFTATSSVNQNLSLFILFLVATILLFYLVWNNVYCDRYAQMLEGLALGNVVFCSGAMIYANLGNNEAWKSAVACISVGIAFIQFLGIVIHCIIRHCLQNFKQQMPTRTTAVAPISVVERTNSTQKRLLNFSDRCETANLHDDGDNEHEPLLAKNSAPLLVT